MLTKAMVTINPEINMGVLAGIITGLVGGAAYNRLVPDLNCRTS
ncbi:hypothetical protein ACNKHM_03545 [Shigella sonnei]